MEFGTFIDQIGIDRLAKTLKVTTQTVSSWRKLDNTPRPTSAFEMICLSHGALTWQSIYEPFVKKTLKGQVLKLTGADGIQMEFKF